MVIATYSDSHADFAIAGDGGRAHVFVEKPLATTVEDAERVVAAAQQPGASWSSATSCATTHPGYG